MMHGQQNVKRKLGAMNHDYGGRTLTKYVGKFITDYTASHAATRHSLSSSP